MVNLATNIPFYRTEDRAIEFIKDIPRNYIRRNNSYVSYFYPLTDQVSMSLTIYNDYNLGDDDDYEAYMNMLFEDLNAMEIDFARKTRTGYYDSSITKDCYPVDILGKKGYEYLKEFDYSELNTIVYDMDGIDNVLEYLSLVFEEAPHLLEDDRIVS